jgi:hypothetical protein
MGYIYTLENNEGREVRHKEFKEIVLWDVTKFIQDSLPRKRPVKITIEEDWR